MRCNNHAIQKYNRTAHTNILFSTKHLTQLKSYSYKPKYLPIGDTVATMTRYMLTYILLSLLTYQSNTHTHTVSKADINYKYPVKKDKEPSRWKPILQHKLNANDRGMREQPSQIQTH